MSSTGHEDPSGGRPAPTLLRRYGARLASLLIVGALVGLELGLRYLGGHGARVVTVPDARLGVVALPDQDVLSRDRSTAVRINDHGFRDRDWGSPGPDSEVIRVALLGDSMTFGVDVAFESTWPRVLERQLAARLADAGDARRVQVMNFSLPSYAGEQKLQVLEDLAAPWAPDFAVYMLAPHDVLLPPVVEGTSRGLLSSLVLRTATYDYFVRRRQRGGIPRTDDGGRPLAWVAHNDEASKGFFLPAMQPHWDRVFEGVDAAARRLAAEGGRLLVVPNPLWSLVEAPGRPDVFDELEEWSAEQPRSSDSAVLVDPRPRFRQATREHAVSLAGLGLSIEVAVDEGGRAMTPLGARLEARTDPRSPWLPTDLTHLSATGHELLAEVVCEALVATGRP